MEYDQMIIIENNNFIFPPGNIIFKISSKYNDHINYLPQNIFQLIIHKNHNINYLPNCVIHLQVIMHNRNYDKLPPNINVLNIIYPITELYNISPYINIFETTVFRYSGDYDDICYFIIPYLKSTLVNLKKIYLPPSCYDYFDTQMITDYNIIFDNYMF